MKFIYFFYFLQELQILEEELLDSMDVQESHIRDLKRELNRLETEHQSLKEPSRYYLIYLNSNQLFVYI